MMGRRILLVAAAWAVGCAGAAPRSSGSTEGDSAEKGAPGTTVEVAAPPEPVPPEEAWRAVPPQPGPAVAPTAPQVEEATLPNGLQLFVSERRELPLVHVQLVTRAGSALDPASRHGLSNLVHKMLPEGTGKKDAVALAEAFGDLGTQLSAWTGHDGGGIGCSVLSRNVGAALSLLSDVIRKPRFDAADFERRRKKILADLVQRRGDPSYLAREALAEAVFGAEHPYGHLPLGDDAGLGAATLDDVKRFYAERIGPKTAALVVVGDISMKEVMKLAAAEFGSWKSKAKPPAPPAAPTTPAPSGVRVVSVPGLEQTFVAMGRPSLAAGGADEWPLEMAISVFGGMFSSRLNMNLREDKGVTYGAFAGADNRFGTGLLLAMSPVDANATRVGVSEMLEELRGMSKRPLTQEELAAAKENFLRSFAGSFESGEALASALGDLNQVGQKSERFGAMMRAIDAMTLDQARGAATRYLDAAAMRIVLVGDPKIIEGAVEGLGLGPLDIRDPAAKNAAK